MTDARRFADMSGTERQRVDCAPSIYLRCAETQNFITWMTLECSGYTSQSSFPEERRSSLTRGEHLYEIHHELELTYDCMHNGRIPKEQVLLPFSQLVRIGNAHKKNQAFFLDARSA